MQADVGPVLHFQGGLMKLQPLLEHRTCTGSSTAFRLRLDSCTATCDNGHWMRLALQADTQPKLAKSECHSHHGEIQVIIK